MNGGDPDGRRGNRVGVLLLAAIVVSAALTPWLGVGLVGAAPCTTVTGGDVIVQSGCYVIVGSQADGDEEDSDASTYVDVQASDVVVDGGGNTIDGTGSGEAVRVDGAYSNVTVRNVALTNWATGVYVKDADAVTVEDVTVRSSGTGVTVDATTNATVERVTASNNADYGTYLKGSPGGVLANVTADGNGKSDVLVEDSDGATVRDAAFSGGGAHGLFVRNSPNASVADVTVENVTTDGISVDSSANVTVGRSTVRGVGRHGVFVTGSPAASVVGVTAEDLSLDGVHVESSDNVLVRDSTARRTGQHGVYVADSKGNASVRNNTAANNTAHGFRVHHSDGSVVEANTARNNGAAGIRVSSELTTVRDNLLERNAHGIYLDKHSHIVENNTVETNGYGITLDGDNTTVAHNRVVESTTAGLRYSSGKDNLAYDNLFSNSRNTAFDTEADESNRWNVSARAGPNVLGGPSVGGNAWLSPVGDGHSERGEDADDDGFVDAAYALNGTSVDELPLKPVGEAPVAEAGPDLTVTNGTAVSLDGSSSTDDVGVVAYEWAFGDGDTSTGTTTTHTYPAPGDYTVTLTVTDIEGNTDTDTATVTVAPAPTSTPTPTPASTPTPTPTPVPPSSGGGGSGGGPDDGGSSGGDPTVEATATPTPDPVENATGTPTPTPAPTPNPVDPDAEVEVDGTDGSSVSVSVDDVEPGREVPVEFGDEALSTGDVSFESLSFTPTAGDPVSMDVTASRDPLPGSPAFDRGDNTSRLAHLRVEHSIANEDVDGAALRFSVSTARLERLGTAPGDVALYRYQNGSWVELPTRVVGETGEGYAFLARSPGLSEFAAGAKRPQFELRTATVEVEEIRVGDEMRVLVRITNTGGADGTYTAKLLLDGEVVRERQLTIASNGTRQVQFQRQMGRPGTYRVLVNDFRAGDVVVSRETSRSTPTGGPVGGQSGLPLELGAGALSALAVLGGMLYRRY